MELVLESPQIQIPEYSLFSAKSYLSDRMQPYCERIVLPAHLTPSGRISIKYRPVADIPSAKHLSRKKRFLGRIGFAEKFNNTIDLNLVFIDFRDHSPQNWAHTLDFYLPFAFRLLNTNEFKALDKKLVCILPTNTPKYIKDVFELFQIDYVCGSLSFVGNYLEVSFSPFDCIRGFAVQAVDLWRKNSTAYANLQSTNEFFSKRVFISRKDTRKIRNEREIEAFLSGKGFTKVYAEDLSVKQQISVFLHSDIVVAIHGAAIAPILYHDKHLSQEKLKIVEIFSPGHVTNFYRGIAHQVGASWVGVRGRIDKNIVGDMYKFSKPFLAHSLASFEVDKESIACALRHIGFAE